MTMKDPRGESLRRESRARIGAATFEGRERPLANAIKLGLAEESPRVPEDDATILGRSRLWYYPLKPQHAFHAWIVDQVSICTLRIERAGRMGRRMRDRAASRAETSWDDDRRLDAEILGADLAKAPSATVGRLRLGLQGVEWLMGRWAMLAHAADLHDGWDEGRRRLAFDLLGTPPEGREAAEPGQEVDGEGRPLGEVPKPADFARAQVAALDALRDDLADADAMDQALAQADLAGPISPEFREVRRDEAALFSRLKWLTNQIRTDSPWKSTNPSLREYFDPVGSKPGFVPSGPNPAYVPVAEDKPSIPPESEKPSEDESEEDESDRPAVIARFDAKPRPKKAEVARQARDRKRSRRKG